MSENILDNFIDKKKAESPYISLSDGESVKVTALKDIKMFSKPGFNGELKETLRLIVEVETPEGKMIKNFDNSTARFANQLRDSKVGLGASFTLTRHGQLTQTRYEIADVKDAEGNAIAPAQTTPSAAQAVASVTGEGTAPQPEAPASQPTDTPSPETPKE